MLSAVSESICVRAYTGQQLEKICWKLPPSPPKNPGYSLLYHHEILTGYVCICFHLKNYGLSIVL